MQHPEKRGLPSSDDRRTAVLLIAHGSREQRANDDLHELAIRLREQGTIPIVESWFLELAEPELKAGGDRCVELGATRVLMVPYFLSDGVHLRRDLAAARDELGRRYPGVEFCPGPTLGASSLARSIGCRADQRTRPSSPVNRDHVACLQPPLTQIEQRHSVRRPISPWMEMVRNTGVNTVRPCMRRQRSDRR